MDKNTTPTNLNIVSQKAVIRDLPKRRVVSPVHVDVSGDSFLFGDKEETGIVTFYRYG